MTDMENIGRLIRKGELIEKDRRGYGDPSDYGIDDAPDDDHPGDYYLYHCY